MAGFKFKAMEEDPSIDAEQLKAANARWDSENHSVSREGRMAPGWNEAKICMRGKLTDKKIAAYDRKGFYSEEYRAFRRKRMTQKSVRAGNFVASGDRLIYSP